MASRLREWMQAALPAPAGYAPPCQRGYFFAIARLVLSSLATYFNSLLYIFDSEDTPVFPYGITIRHTGDVIGHGADAQ